MKAGIFSTDWHPKHCIQLMQSNPTFSGGEGTNRQENLLHRCPCIILTPFNKLCLLSSLTVVLTLVRDVYYRHWSFSENGLSFHLFVIRHELKQRPSTKLIVVSLLSSKLCGIHIEHTGFQNIGYIPFFILNLPLGVSPRPFLSDSLSI